MLATAIKTGNRINNQIGLGVAQVVDKNLNQRTYIVQAEHTEIIFGAIIMRLFRLVEWTGALIGLSTEIESFFLGGGPAYHYATDYWVFPGKTDSTSTTQAQYNYDAYGRVTTVSPTAPGDFRQARAYEPVLGGVNLAHFHTYDPPTAKCYYTRDHLGSVREMLNSSGTIVARYNYDSYGVTTLVSGTDMATFGFAGMQKDPENGLYYTLYRIYDALMALWRSRDPLGEGGGLNLYGYVGNDPVNGIDPLGLITIIIPGVGPQRDNGGNSSNEDFIRGALRHYSDGQVFSRDQLDQAIAAINQAAAAGDHTVNIIGYSRGGYAAIQLANMLNDPKSKTCVNSVVTIDPVREPQDRLPNPLPVPSNVQQATDYYHDAAHGTPRQGPTDFPGTPLAPGPNVNNVPVTPSSFPNNNYPIRHENMPIIILGR